MRVSYATQLVRDAVLKLQCERVSLAGCRCYLSQAACKGLFDDFFACAWRASDLAAAAAADHATRLAAAAPAHLPAFCLSVSIFGLALWCDPAAVVDVRVEVV